MIYIIDYRATLARESVLTGKFSLARSRATIFAFNTSAASKLRAARALDVAANPIVTRSSYRKYAQFHVLYT